MTGHIFFITGASGAGKTTLQKLLVNALDSTLYAVHDFDEGGVPTNANALWRQTRTDEWLAIANTNAKNHTSTIICGVSVPLEVRGSPEFDESIVVYFASLLVSRELHQKRIQERGWSMATIKNDLNWASVLQTCVEKERGLVINATEMSADVVAKVFLEWIASKV
jgi:broad-specificity NMP kinase